jgi:stearoyl-CoA desaturase (delta-9 desaturase)
MIPGLFELPWWGYALLTLALTHITIAAVTIYLHRHQAHRALELHPLPAHFFRFWLWLTTGMVTKEWAAIHRKHHARCETPEDPHSPQQRGLLRVLLGGVFLYVAESRNEETLTRYGQGTPDDWIERHLYTPHQKLGIVLMLVIDVALFGALAGVSIWAVQMVWIPFWAAGVINGIGHFWGYRSFDCEDASRNIVPWGVLIGGEELHNNHHAFAASARLSYRWYEFDVGWAYIRLLESVGLATVKKIAPRLQLGEPRTEIDQATVDAVITHRYDLLQHYGASLRELLTLELAGIGARLRRSQIRTLVKRLSVGDNAAAPLGGELRQMLDRVLKESAALQTASAMRQELALIWSRSNATREQVLTRLDDWVQRAEASGVRQLQQIALRLRCYAVN